MNFKKLALVTAIAAAPLSVFAVDSLEDAMLSGVTGQDGIAINLKLDVTTDVIVVDTDGIDNVSTAYSFDGAIVISGLRINTGARGLNIQIDASETSAASGSAPVLNVFVDVAANTVIETGDITVGNANRDNSGWGIEPGTESGIIMQNATITLGQTDLNIQLGNEARGNLIRIDTEITNGIQIANPALVDAGGSVTGGVIGAGSVTMLDNRGTNLTAAVGVDVTRAGLVLTLDQLGDPATGMDIRIERQYFGTTTAGYIGDLEFTGVAFDNPGLNTITILGK